MPPSPGLTATATCLDGCGVLAEGDPATVDKTAAKHVKATKHATAVVAVPG